MKRARIIPILLLKGGGLHKTFRFEAGKYLGDPINAVKIFNDKQCDELVLLDTHASKEGKTINFPLIEEIASECFMPLTYGGGISNLNEIECLLKIGVEKVALNSILLHNPGFVENAVRTFGGSTIVASIDIKKNLFGQYKIFSHSGINVSGFRLDDLLNWVNEISVGEVMVNSVDKDGLMNGYDMALAHKLSETLSMPLVFAGGCNSLADMKVLLKETQVSAAAAGSFFVFQGPHKAVLISYPTPASISEICNK